MKPINVDEYIASCPQEWQPRLRQLRAAIKTSAPGAVEKISYGMPYYGYKGRLVYFQLWTKHIGLYLPPPIIHDHSQELTHYVTTKATIQFPLKEKFPIALIKKLIKARVAWNDRVDKERKKV